MIGIACCRHQQHISRFDVTVQNAIGVRMLDGQRESINQFGASAGIGGTVSVPIHLDAVVLDATLEIDGRRVLDAGNFLL